MPEEKDFNNNFNMDTESLFHTTPLKTMEEYRKLYDLSIYNPGQFWRSIASEFSWKKPPSKDNLLTYNFDLRKGPVEIKWMDNAETNICYNALDKNLQKGLSNKVAFYWEGNDVGESQSITYGQLYRQVCKFANVLKSKGVKAGDRVTIYMPMTFELVTAMLACSRLGAVHNVVFGGFSSDALADRIIDSKSSLLVTAYGTWRGSKFIDLKEIAEKAMDICSSAGVHVKCIIACDVYNKYINNGMPSFTIQASHLELGSKISSDNDQMSWWHDEMKHASCYCEPIWVQSEHPSFIIYSSGSTGKPKGVLHSTAGYMLYAATTFKYTFSYRNDDVYFCTADFGWITGHTYGLYGPLLNGATSVIFQGIPTYPDAGRYWTICEKYKVSLFYTSPTAIRSLMKFDNLYVNRCNLESLRVLGTVGEPINPEAWQWYFDIVGKKKCSIVDTYWQSETGGHVITPLAHCTPLKPGSATFPFFGVEPALLNEQGKEIVGAGEGYLAFKKPWPGMLRSLYGNHARFSSVYFSKFPGYYCTGDGATRDNDGYYWITGRTDDMLNVSGHLLSTSEVESALVEHEACAEAAVVSHPHSVKGECLYCYVVLKEGYLQSDELSTQLKEKVRSKIGAFATPDFIHFTPVLPKTRSGKILRRVLRKISRNETDLGDLSTLSEQSAIDEICTTKPLQLTNGGNLLVPIISA